MILIRLEYKNNVEQFEKVLEEVEEVKDELQRKEIDKSKLLSECWDVIQAVFGIMFLNFSIKEIFKGYKTHLLKLQGRHNDKKIKIDEYVEVS